MMTKEKFLKRYGFFDDLKYLLPGAEITKYIGQRVFKIKYEKINGNWTETMNEPITILEIGKFDPITISYTCKYKNNKEETEELSIIPEGLSWDPDLENTGYFYKLSPLSIYAKFNEDEYFYTYRLPKLYETKETVPIKLIETISNDKCQPEILRYSHNFGMICKTELNIGGEIAYAWVRITKLSITHKSGTIYYLTLQNEKDTWKMTIDSKDKEYKLPGIGTFKLIDLSN